MGPLRYINEGWGLRQILKGFVVVYSGLCMVGECSVNSQPKTTLLKQVLI